MPVFGRIRKGRKFTIEGGEVMRFQLYTFLVGREERISSIFKLKRVATAVADSLRKDNYEARVLKTKDGWQVWQWPPSKKR